MALATVGGQDVAFNKPAVVILVAIISIVPGLITAGIDHALRPEAQATTAALEADKVELERQTAAALLYQRALSNPDPAQRRALLHFLVGAGVIDDVDDFIKNLPADQVPHWLVTASTSP